MKIIAACSPLTATAFVARALDNSVETVIGLSLVFLKRNRHFREITDVTSLAVLALFADGTANAISLNDIQLWTGSGTNRAAMVVEWNSPVVSNNTIVPSPVANKTLVWGYQFNGSATGTQMLNAILASDPRLYAVVNNAYGTFVEGIGYNLSGNGLIGVADGNYTYNASAFVNGCLLNANLNPDAAYPLNNGDLFWSGYFGPNWNVWNELGDSGGFSSSPNRGTNQYWNSDTGIQGQWAFSDFGLDDLPLYDGSWIGFSVAGAGYDTNSADPATTAFNLDEQAPPSPDGTYVAYICDTNDFGVQIVSTNNIDPNIPYNNPLAVLGRPTLKFIDHFYPNQVNIIHRAKIIEAPYWTDPSGNDVITEISSNGQITVNMGRRICDNPNNPYGIDFIVYGNSFFPASHVSGSEVNDFTDLNTALIPGGILGIYGHPATVSVSQDGTNWYTYANTQALFPENAYRWDDTNASWTDEQLNPTKPLNPAISIPDGSTVASALDQFIGSSGGSGYDLRESGLPWIQYVQIQPGPGTYAVIDAIAAVNPVVVGDALSIAPDNLTSGITNLDFQNPANSNQSLISINFDSVSEAAEVHTVGLSDFSSFAPVPGSVTSAYQITVTPVTGTTPVSFLADVALSAGNSYTGNGSDLRVLQWNGASWNVEAFTYNTAINQVCVTGLTNFSAFVVSRLSPQLILQAGTNGFNIPLTPFPNVTYMLQRSTNLVTWTCVSTITPTSEQPVALQDPNPPAGQAFYRLQIDP